MRMDAARPPFVLLRDFQVWFEKRTGFLTALRRGEPEHVRAVDGIDLEIGKGEIYCLVGKSGCGKTTTGMGILQLVEPTGGDVFVGASSETLDAYHAARAKGDEAALDELRRRHSLTYREKIEWGPSDTILFGLESSGLFVRRLGGPGIQARPDFAIIPGERGTLCWYRAP